MVLLGGKLLRLILTKFGEPSRGKALEESQS